MRGMPPIDEADCICEACLVGKKRRASSPHQALNRAETVLELVHADICGPISPPTSGGKHYFLLLVDDKRRNMWLRLLRTDHGGEFTSSSLGRYFANQGVKRQLTAPYSPQKNGVAEWRNQTVVGMARTLLKAKGVPGCFWGEAVTTAVYLLNRSTTKSVAKMTPYEAWCGKRPTVHHLRAFGCIAHVKTTRPNARKLDDRSQPMVLFGYEPGTAAYRVYHSASRKAHVYRDVIFDENVFPFASLHPNAGARLRAEILLLSPELLNPSDHGGECSADDHVFNNPNPATNGGCAEQNSEKIALSVIILCSV